MFSSSHVIATVNLIRQAHLFTFVKHICSHSLSTFAQRNSFVEVRLQQCVRYLQNCSENARIAGELLWLRFGAHVFSRPLFLSSEMGLENPTPESLHVYSKNCGRVSKIIGKRLEYSENRAPKRIFEFLAAVL